jgi:Raf kinase inhibitor-like YbhB/YbcL family protein
MPFVLSSPAFLPGSKIPKRFSGEGENVSPLLRWRDAPEGAESLALIMEDPDAPSGTFYHWLVFNIPISADSLPESEAHHPAPGSSILTGKNSAGESAYLGPYPPPGKPHRYYFRLFALDRMLSLAPGCSISQLQKAMQGHILATAETMGIYQR